MLRALQRRDACKRGILPSILIEIVVSCLYIT